MKNNLSRLLTAAFLVLFAVSGAAAQESHPMKENFNKQLTFKALGQCLRRTDVPGFVECALYTVAQCKNRFPEWNYTRLLGEVNKVAREDDNPSIRYKAYLVSMYLTHSSDIQVNFVSDPSSHDYLFKEIANQLERRYLAFDGSENAGEKR